MKENIPVNVSKEKLTENKIIKKENSINFSLNMNNKWSDNNLFIFIYIPQTNGISMISFVLINKYKIKRNRFLIL